MSLFPIKFGHFSKGASELGPGVSEGEREPLRAISVCQSAMGLVGLEPCWFSKPTSQVQVLKDGVLGVGDKPFTPQGEAPQITDWSSRGGGERRGGGVAVGFMASLSQPFLLALMFFSPLAWCEGVVLLVSSFFPQGNCFTHCYRFGVSVGGVSSDLWCPLDLGHSSSLQIAVHL